ncbi:LADA_0G11276g1_1 [Lachancea dasiensis]|uniref:Transcription factor BYE1 n=1 Tax=Lachancea dasiensis TaxID=1072105 RepID=A0A1G4JUW2_9SACH|nr:LADA_0G11276g1_1 [Lachancea dasiensis]
MDEGIRRSSRSNKGTNKFLQSQRLAELEYVKTRDEYNQNGEPKDVVKCLPCGTNDENYDENTDPYGDMIQCDTCDTWQHIKCMTGKESAEDLGTYNCSVCSPSSFPSLKPATMASAVNTVNRNKRLSFEEQGGDEYAADDLQSTQHRNDEDLDEIPAKRKKRSVSTKRGERFESDQNKLRDSAMGMFEELFVKYVIPDTIAADTFKLPSEASADELSRRLAQELERELYRANENRDTSKVSDLYKEKVRVLYSNLKDKKNINMKSLVVNEALPFSKLVMMPVNELINPDLQQFRERVGSQALNQLIVELPHKPRYFKTHKGDELIEDPNSFEPEDIIFSKDNIAAKLDEEGSKEEGVSAHSDKPVGTTINGASGVQRATKDSSQSPHLDAGRKCSIEYKEINVKFFGVLKYVGSSADVDKKVRIDATGDNIFVVEGRLKENDAQEYIQQMSTSRTFIAYALRPHGNAEDFQRFEELFEFLHSRQRYGALEAKKPFVRHVYVVPCSGEVKPDILKYIKSEEAELLSGKALMIVAIIRPEMVAVT